MYDNIWNINQVYSFGDKLYFIVEFNRYFIS